MLRGEDDVRLLPLPQHRVVVTAVHQLKHGRACALAGGLCHFPARVAAVVRIKRGKREKQEEGDGGEGVRARRTRRKVLVA